ncbi:MAG TPA: type I secretion system permease/ATPase, partial [Hyphomicrobiales bacterium]|nr:type I secretion system permease/ATPase [Hyphomicrobiales bacterium]
SLSPTLSCKSPLPVALPSILFLDGDVPAVVIREVSEDCYAVQLPNVKGIRTVQLKDLEERYSGRAIGVELVYSAPGAVMDEETRARLHTEHWFWSALRRHRKDYVSIVLAASLINLLGLAAPLFIMNVYDRVLPNKAFPTLWVLAAGLVLALVFNFVLTWARARLIDDVARHIDIRLSSTLFEKVLNMSLAVRPTSTGAFVSHISQYEFLREFFTSNTVALFTDLAFIGVFFLVIWQLSGWLVIFPALAVVIVIAAGLMLQFLIGRKLTVAQGQSAMRQGLLVETISSIETVKSLRAEGHLLRRWDDNAHATSGTSEEIKRLSSIGLNVAQLCQQLATIGIVAGGTYAFAAAEMSSGAIIATVILSSRAIAPLSQIAMTLTRARQAWLSFRLLDSIMKLPDERISTRSFVNRKVAKGGYQFSGVRFHYPHSDRNILNDVSFKAGAGEKIGIVGRIGSGKTTVARLMSGLYFATEGEILLDGVDIRQYHPQEVRNAVGFVNQEADLFDGSVKDNILLGDPEADDEALIAAAKMAGVDSFVSQHPMGYDMPTGERGSALSGGQRQAIALARVLIKKPRILILDEPTSSMDIPSERQLILHLKKAILPGQTVFVATHRQGMLELVDRLLVLEGGRLVADGPRDAILDAMKKTKVPNREN